MMPREMVVVDKDVLLGLADSFALLAATANGEGLASSTHPMVMAGAVNAGLSLEYLAKALNLVVLGEFERTHDLTKLADALPADVRQSLQITYEVGRSKEEVKRAEDAAKAAGVAIDPGFGSVMKNWSRLFVEGRYWFEGQKNPALHWFFFEPLSQAYKSVIDGRSDS